MIKTVTWILKGKIYGEIWFLKHLTVVFQWKEQLNEIPWIRAKICQLPSLLNKYLLATNYISYTKLKWLLPLTYL